MEKYTKNIITRELIEKELHFYNTADIKYALVLCGAFSLCFLPLMVGVVYGILSLPGHMLLKIVLSLVMGALISTPIWIFSLSLHRALVERKMLMRGEFDIVTRDVSYKSEKMVHRHTEEYLHFGDFNDVSVEHTTFQLATAGDTFYIVHYKMKKNIKLLYSAKMYEYQ